ncbi:hypothetical protein NECAME_06887 [Necator americanus]|uniref:Uncharacterized protein n=1 Tax=Necator americanus TaxID=51031 RepID=W2TS35_NECAM|nr:hypothetical protein NECAME_06887 [Necator americanus]ETN84484.1 hypothetical protein NECAME_06887 [Necator americanus]
MLKQRLSHAYAVSRKPVDSGQALLAAGGHRFTQPPLICSVERVPQGMIDIRRVAMLMEAELSVDV